jgi:polyphosphate kinase 2 (PPK2 family)
MPRFALRQSRIAIQRRAASSTSEAAASGANKAKQAGQETASKAKQVGQEAASKVSETASKAQEGLSRVQSTAGEKISSAGSALSKSLAGIGGRTGQLISFVNSVYTRSSAHFYPSLTELQAWFLLRSTTDALLVSSARWPCRAATWHLRKLDTIRNTRTSLC